MSLIKCNVCGHEISDQSISCPFCHSRLKKYKNNVNIISDIVLIIFCLYVVLFNVLQSEFQIIDNQEKFVHILLFGEIGIVSALSLVNTRFNSTWFVGAACIIVSLLMLLLIEFTELDTCISALLIIPLALSLARLGLFNRIVYSFIVLVMSLRVIWYFLFLLVQDKYISKYANMYDSLYLDSYFPLAYDKIFCVFTLCTSVLLLIIVVVKLIINRKK